MIRRTGFPNGRSVEMWRGLLQLILGLMNSFLGVSAQHVFRVILHSQGLDFTEGPALVGGY